LYAHKNIHSFRYHVTYRIKKTDHQYIRVLRETIPYLTDQQGKIISTISRYTDISNLGHPKEIKAWITTPHKTINLSGEFKNILSRREKEVLHYLAKGLSSKTIAKHLCISKLTVDKHRANMLKKTETNNTSELIRFSLENGILVF
jgi:DNA-binding NarL/FixJ family response regulator